MTAADDLLVLVPPPADSGAPPDWRAVEDDLGLPLPADYKWLVEQYGPGSFGRFLHILQPNAALEPVRLESQARRSQELLRIARDSGEPMPYEVHELMPVAVTDNGDTIYWLKRPPDDPDAWRIVANGARNTKWSVFAGGIVEFLLAVMSGTHPTSVFPAAFPGPHQSFATYAARRRSRPADG